MLKISDLQGMYYVGKVQKKEIKESKPDINWVIYTNYYIHMVIEWFKKIIRVNENQYELLLLDSTYLLPIWVRWYTYWIHKNDIWLAYFVRKDSKIYTEDGKVVDINE